MGGRREEGKENVNVWLLIEIVIRNRSTNSEAKARLPSDLSGLWLWPWHDSHMPGNPSRADLFGATAAKRIAAGGAVLRGGDWMDGVAQRSRPF